MAQDVAADFGGARIGALDHVVRVRRGAVRQRPQKRRKSRREQPHGPPDERALAMGGANCGSMSHGNRIQVSWLTSVT